MPRVTRALHRATLRLEPCVCGGGGCKAKALYGETPSEQTDGQTRVKTLHFPQLGWRAALKSALCQVEVSGLRLVND